MFIFKKLLFVVAFLFVALISYGQKVTVKGQVRDSLEGVLPSATVVLLNVEDSTLINFNISDTGGNFKLKGDAGKSYLLQITFLGYQNYMEKISLSSSGEDKDMGTIVMKPKSETLDEVTVEGEAPPVVIKKDTIEFNAPSFKVRENATVEELLKKLPGVEVDDEGNITAHGEEVKKVMVDGKEFFGTDPKIATKNLPADAIAKIQLYDKKSDQATFTGIDDGDREKTINLKLKEDRKNGSFGRMEAGVGTNDRYKVSGSLNRFRKNEQMSIIGMGNNVNDQGFSTGGYTDFTGGSASNGIMKSYAGGLNINHDFNEDTEVYGNYFYNYLDHDITQNTIRENYLESGNYTYTSDSRQHNTNQNHRINLTVDHTIDSANSIKFTSNVTFNSTDSHALSSGENVLEDGTLENENNRLTNSEGNTNNYDGTLLWRHRFNKQGRTISANLTASIQQGDRDGGVESNNTYYTDGVGEDELVWQSNDQSTLSQNYGVTMVYTEPLGTNKYLEVNYKYQRNLNDVDKVVYDLTEDDATLNETLTNKYNSDYEYQQPGLDVVFNGVYYTLTVGGSWQHTDLVGDLITRDETINKTFQNILPTARFNYDFSSSRHLRFDYETSMGEPSIQQLQPVIDNSDPLNISEGNPDLRPSYQHSGKLSYFLFDPASFFTFIVMANGTYTTNAIVNSRSVDDQLVTTTKPVNVDNVMSSSLNVTLAKPISQWNSRVSINASRSDSKSIAVLNDADNVTRQGTTRGNVRYNYHYKEIFDVSVGADVSYQRTHYEFDQADQNYLNSSYNFDADVSFLKNYRFNGTLKYSVYDSKSTNFNQSIPMINMSVSRMVFKNKRGEVSFAVKNLLDRALGVSQSASANYLQITTTNSLGRYYMVSFTYGLNKMFKGRRDMMGGPPGGGGGMMRMPR